jgi:GT2 family glycosyltransferase
MPDKVAFIVVGWNNTDILPDCFKSIYEQSYDNTAVYFVDNGSKDDSVEKTKKDFPQVKIIEPGYNTGFAKGNNIGIKEALKDPDVKYIALLNSDARLKPEWTKTIVDFA